MPNRSLSLALLAMMAAFPAMSGNAADKIERGSYLVRIAGCGDCHTPGNFLGHPDTTKYLGGSDVGFGVPGMGVFVGPNLTPDRKTGLGYWTEQQIITAITAGTRPDGRKLAPIMPWQDLSHLSRTDALAIAAYLKSLAPISNQVAGPFGPNEKPTVPVMSVLPPDIYANLQQTK